jgi:hypothetical protein
MVSGRPLAPAPPPPLPPFSPLHRCNRRQFPHPPPDLSPASGVSSVLVDGWGSSGGVQQLDGAVALTDDDVFEKSVKSENSARESSPACHCGRQVHCIPCVGHGCCSGYFGKCQQQRKRKHEHEHAAACSSAYGSWVVAGLRGYDHDPLTTFCIWMFRMLMMITHAMVIEAHGR